VAGQLRYQPAAARLHAHLPPARWSDDSGTLRGGRDAHGEWSVAERQPIASEPELRFHHSASHRWRNLLQGALRRGEEALDHNLSIHDRLYAGKSREPVGHW